MTNNTIPNVPRELLADLLGNDHDKRIMAERHLLAMLANAPSPAGVDGLEVVGYIGGGTFSAATEAAFASLGSSIVRPLCMYDDAQAIIDGLRGEVAKINSDRLACWAEFKVMTRACLDAEKERDQQAQRIGELEGLLRAESARVDFLDAYIVTADAPDTGKAAMLADSGTLRECIDAALSAGKDGE